MANLFNAMLLKPAGGSLSPTAFEFTIKTNNAGGVSNNTSLTLPLLADGTYDFLWTPKPGATPVHITAYNDPAITYDYGVAGTYKGHIIGTIKGFAFDGNNGDGDDGPKLLDISQWGSIVLQSDPVTYNNIYYFGNCPNLVSISALDEPDFSNMTDISGMFYNTTSLVSIPRINYWNVSNIIYFSSFLSGSILNCDFGDWNTANGVDFSFLVGNNPNFNGRLDTLNYSKAYGVSFMLYQATGWHRTANFVFPVATSLSFFMYNVPLFNGDMSGFVTSSALVNMDRSFQTLGSTFNQPRPTGLVTSGVTSATNTYSDLPAFNQDLSGMNVANMTDMRAFLDNSTLSNANYNKLLVSMAGQAVKSNVGFSGGNSHYDTTSGGVNGVVARAFLTVTKGWTITDAGTP